MQRYPPLNAKLIQPVGLKSFLFMMNNIDNITNKNHPSKKLKGNIMALSKAYHVINSTERN